jgi:uncharacterized Zn-finger protein
MNWIYAQQEFANTGSKIKFECMRRRLDWRGKFRKVVGSQRYFFVLPSFLQNQMYYVGRCGATQNWDRQHFNCIGNGWIDGCYNHHPHIYVVVVTDIWHWYSKNGEVSCPTRIQ